MTAKARILIVDDEALTALALAGEFEGDGFEVVGPYSNAEDAMAAVAEDLPDAAFLDVNLGQGRTSFDLAAMLLEKEVPVTFLTGYSARSIRDERVAKAGFLVKPVLPEQAIAEARRMLNVR